MKGQRKRRMKQGQRREETCEWRRSPDGECRDEHKKLREREREEVADKGGSEARNVTDEVRRKGI
jgi:hypothetical protein